MSPMTGDDWNTLWITFVAALAGGVGGSVIVWFTAKKADASGRQIALEDRQERARLAAEERAAQAVFAAEQRELDTQQQRLLRAKEAADQMMPLVTDIRDHIPALMVVGQTVQHSAATIRARDAYRRSIARIVPLITDKDVTERCRNLQFLVGQLQGRVSWPAAIEDRVRADAMRYATYVLLTLVRFIQDAPLPERTEPPVLKRNPHDGSAWTPSEYTNDYEALL